MNPRRALPLERFVTLGQHCARVLDTCGIDPVLVLLASPLVNADVYRPTLAALAHHWRALVVELPGAGRASTSRRPLTIPELAELVPLLLDVLELGHVLLVGHSNSGPIALEVARRHPERLTQLVLVDAVGAHPGRLLPIVAGRLRDGVQEWRLSLSGWPAMVQNLLRHRPNFLAQIRWSAGDAWLPAAYEVKCPVLLAWGGRDRTMPLAMAERYLAAFPQARLITSPSGSHDWLIERPGEFAGALFEAETLPDRGPASPPVDHLPARPEVS